jgi:hypothetical protein
MKYKTTTLVSKRPTVEEVELHQRRCRVLGITGLEPFNRTNKLKWKNLNNSYY